MSILRQLARRATELVLDPLHIFVIAAVTSAFCSVLLYISRGRNRGVDPLGWWAIAVALGAIGLMVAALPAFVPAPPQLSNDISKALLLLACGVSWMGARAFARRKQRPIAGLTGTLLWLAATQIPGFESLDMASVQVMLFWGLGAAYTFATLATLWPDGSERLPSRPAILVLLGVHGAASAIQAVLAGAGLEGLLQTLISGFQLLEAQLYIVGMSFLALALTKERAELTVARSRDSARDAGEARRRFLAQMSHEVRTPLNGVLGLAQVLHRDPRLLPDQRQQVQTLEAAGRHLLAIVNDALDLAKIDAGRLDYVIRPFNPADAVEGCLALVRPGAMDKNITLRLELVGALPPLVAGDTTRLQQILLNLLWNALKFTPAKSRVTLRVGAGNGWLRFDVIDNGPGIPADKQSLLFQDFARIDPEAADGTGLGLVISSRLAERMGGRLTYHPGPGGVGSLFQLELPWSAAEAEAPPPAPVAPATPAASLPKGLRLLVVDDVRANRSLLCALLSAEGHVATEAEDGLEAVEMTAQQYFDAVLMDIRMPGIDGIEAARRIRALPGEAGTTPIIAVSADVMRETVQQCLAAGMNAMVPKPIERETLLGALRRLDLDRYGQTAPAAGS